MGDRANVVLCFEDNENTELYLYTHWNGYEWPERLREALEFGKSRWDDDSYLARIIVSRMFESDFDSVTGSGLSPYLTDNEYPLVYVNLVSNEVHIEDKTFTFQEYVNISNASYAYFGMG